MSSTASNTSSQKQPEESVRNLVESVPTSTSFPPASCECLSSLLSSIRTRQLRHRTRGQWSQAEAWTRHNLQATFPAFVQESFKRFGPSAPPLSAYASVETFRARLEAEAEGKRHLNVRNVSEIPRLDGAAFTKAAFQELVEQNDLPCIFSHLSDKWRMKSWTMEALASPSFKYAQVKFKVDEHAANNEEGDVSGGEEADAHEQQESEEQKEHEDEASSSIIDSLQSDSFKLSLHDFMQYLSHNRDDVPLYIFDAVFDCDSLGREIMDDFTPPPLFQPDLFKYLGPVRRPPFQWILIGPTRSGSALHTDPLQTSAWNTCIDGVKRWVLFPPHVQREKVKGQHLVSADFNRTKSSSSDASTGDTPPLTADDIDDAMEAAHYFTHSLPLLRAQAASPSLEENITANLSNATSSTAAPIPLEFLQYPGETVFVPSGWLHAVINLTPTLAMTQNFISPRHFADSYVETYIKRPHMCARWKEQLKRYEPEMFELTQQLEAMPPLCLAPPLPFSQPNRRPSSSYNKAAEDGDSWYYENSSEEEDGEEEDEKADSSYA